jgi:hypothetical protein
VSECFDKLSNYQHFKKEVSTLWSYSYMNLANGAQSLLNLTFYILHTFSKKSKLQPHRKQVKVIFRELFQFRIFHHPFTYLKA